LLGSPSASIAMSSTPIEWRSQIAAEWNRRRELDGESDTVRNGRRILFPLAMNPFGAEEILAMTEVLLTGRLTLGEQVDRAEKAFAKALGVPYAVMVNSGSSANLLAVSAIANKLRAVHCDVGDEVLVPAVCWSTSVHPLLQLGLKPVFVDVDPTTFNVSLEELERKYNPRVKAVLAVHVLGNSMDMDDLVTFVKRHNLMLVEDTCESLGSYSTCTRTVVSDAVVPGGRKMLGTYGDFGTYSFYFSHHITSGEGGMVTCHTETDFNFIRCLRAHGWTRHLTNRAEVEAQYPDIDSRFLFINVGYNLRPLEVQAAMLNVQLHKLHAFNENRRENLRRITAAFDQDGRLKNFMSIMQPAKGVDPAWFGIGAVLHRPYAHQLADFLKYLEENGIENRPVISGNFIRQPCIATYCDNELPENYPGAEVIHHRGFFIGIHQITLAQDVIDKLVSIICNFKFVRHEVVLVTGSRGMLGRYVQSVVAEKAVSTTGGDDAVHTRAVAADSTSSSSLEAVCPPVRIHTADTEWIFVHRAHGDLRKEADVAHLFKKYQPTSVLHCAATLASMSTITAKPVEFWLDNCTVNNNVLKTAHNFQRWIGPVKVLSVLSTVMFPASCPVPFDANNSTIFASPPPAASEAYAYAKRSLLQLTNWYRKEYKCDFITVLPGNIFGAYGDFNPATAPLVNSVIAKVANQLKSNPSAPLPMLGTGNAERQLMFTEDLARILVWALNNYSNDEPLVVCGEEVSISSLATTVAKLFNFNGGVQFDGDASKDGPLRRTASTDAFKALYPEFKFTSLNDGLNSTIQWFNQNIAK